MYNMYDTLRINNTQAKILNSFLKFEKRFNQKGVSEYDLAGSVGKKIPKKYQIPRATFKLHIDDLKKIQAVRLIEDKKKQWKKKRHRVRYAYEVTSLGILLLLKYSFNNKLSIKDFAKEAFNKLPINQYLPILKAMYDEKIIEQLVRGSIEAISLRRLGATIVTEFTELELELHHLTIVRGYSLKLKGDYELEKKKQEKFSFEFGLFGIPSGKIFPNYSTMEIDILWRATAVFFFDILRFGRDEDTKFITRIFYTEKNKEKYSQMLKDGRDPTAIIAGKIYDSEEKEWQKYKRNQKKILELIMKNEKLFKAIQEIFLQMDETLQPFNRIMSWTINNQLVNLPARFQK